jgi:GNAT superfamily N-acetyltransferase
VPTFEKVNAENFSRVPEPCRLCLYWQTSGELQPQASKSELEKAKLEWFRATEKAFGNCAKIACVDNVPIGFMQYAMPKYFPRIADYASGPPSGDAVFIACLYITSKNHRGKGCGTSMLKNILEELCERGFVAVETFARADSENNPSGPLAFYLKHGFKVVRRKDDFPLVRLELFKG